MIRFNSDYTEGCHTAILEKLVETNMEQTAGYGEDEYCGQARELIRKACGDELSRLSAILIFSIACCLLHIGFN